MLSSLVILFGVVKQFGRFLIWSETECKIPAEYGLQHNSHPPPPDKHCLYILYIQFGKGGRSERRQRGNKSKVPSSMGATVHKLSRKYQPMSECISSLYNLLNTMPQIPLKVPKREIFVTELIILSHPIWRGDLRTKEKNLFVRIVRLLFAILFFFR